MASAALFMASHGFALLSLWLQRFVLAWYLWRSTESPLVLGLAVACELLPGLMLVGRIGSDLDRGNQRAIVGRAQLTATCAAMLLVLALWLGGWIALAVLPLLLFAAGTGGAYLLSGRFSLLASLRSPPVPLARLSTAMALTGQLATLLAPLAGGLALQWLAEWQVMLLVAAGYLLSTGILTRVAFEARALRGGAAGGDVGWLRVWQLARKSSVLFLVLALFLFVQTGGRAVTDFLSGFVGQILGGDASLLSVMTALTAVGGLGATLFVMYLANVTPLTFMVLSLAGSAVALSMMAASRSVLVHGASMIIIGAALSLASVASQVYLQERAPLQIRGRLMTTYTLIWRGSPVLAAATVGPALSWFGFQWLPLLAGVFIALGAAAAAVSAVRRQPATRQS